MTILEWLVDKMQKLHQAGVDSPRRDCLVLLEDTLRKDRAWVVTHPEHKLQSQVIKKLNTLINRRLEREPLAYIRGKAWFYGRFFEVTRDVMIPRPESESFIELLKKLAGNGQLSEVEIADIGTGSGCLAITAKLEFRGAKVLALDQDSGALKIARQNAKNHKADIKFLSGSLLEPLQTAGIKPSILLVNLPYVPDNFVTSPEILREPPQALFSGKFGLDHYQKFWQEVTNLSSKPQHILTESLEKQHKNMLDFAKEAGYEHLRTDVLIQHFVKRD